MYTLCYLPEIDSYEIMYFDDAIARKIDYLVHGLGMRFDLVSQSESKEELEYDLSMKMKAKLN